MDLVDVLIFLAFSLIYFLIFLIVLVALVWFGKLVVRDFRSARAIWISICIVHLMAFLAYDYYHPEIPGDPNQPRFAEQFQGISLLPMMAYCFPSSVLSYALGAALDHVLCPSLEACDSMLVFVPIWWLMPVTLGYLQWFRLFPWLLKKFENRPPAPGIS
jgi:hypothetical protein